LSVSHPALHKHVNLFLLLCGTLAFAFLALVTLADEASRTIATGALGYSFLHKRSDLHVLRYFAVSLALFARDALGVGPFTFSFAGCALYLFLHGHLDRLAHIQFLQCDLNLVHILVLSLLSREMVVLIVIVKEEGWLAKGVVEAESMWKVALCLGSIRSKAVVVVPFLGIAQYLVRVANVLELDT
jgi:hypothetical protein